MEVGWYLRFSKTGTEAFLVDTAQLGQLEHMLTVLPEWSMETQRQEDHILARFTRS